MDFTKTVLFMTIPWLLMETADMKNPEAQVVHCKHRITIEDIQQTRRAFPNICETDQRMFHRAMTLIVEHPAEIWKNAEIRIYGLNIDIFFKSGNGKYIRTILLDGEGKPQVYSTKEFRVQREIACYPGISAHHINIALKEIVTLTDEDQKLLEFVKSEIASESPWVWKDAVIIVQGRYMELEFHASHKSNRFVAYFDPEKEIPVFECIQYGLRLMLRNLSVNLWNFGKNFWWSFIHLVKRCKNYLFHLVISQ